MRLVIVGFVLVCASFGCGRGGGPDEGVGARQQALGPGPAFVLTPYVPDAAVALPKSTEGSPIAAGSAPTPADYLERQAKYLQLVTASEAQWRSEGRSDAEVVKLKADLKREILGD
jgi:hypothetical protein